MGIFLLVVNLVLSIPCLLVILNAQDMGERGTNAATRFVRDVGRNQFFLIVQVTALPVTMLFLLIGCLCKAPYACLPTTACSVLIFVFKYKSTKNKQRIKDARVVTKTGGKVVARGAAAAGTAVATYYGGPVAGKAAMTASKSLVSVTDKCLDSMEDVDGPNIAASDLEGLNSLTSTMASVDFKNPDKFIEAAKRAGIDTDGKDLSTIAGNVIKFAPKTALEQLPEDMSLEDKAMHIMGGKY